MPSPQDFQNEFERLEGQYTEDIRWFNRHQPWVWWLYYLTRGITVVGSVVITGISSWQAADPKQLLSPFILPVIAGCVAAFAAVEAWVAPRTTLVRYNKIQITLRERLRHYQRIWKLDLALSDPIAENKGQQARTLLDEMDREHKETMIANIDEWQEAVGEPPQLAKQ